MVATTPKPGTHMQAPGKLQPSGDSKRLPCRGCTRDCGNYARCNGKPWRL